VLKRPDAVRQLRAMVQQIERDDLSGMLDDSFGQALPLTALRNEDTKT